MKKGILFSIMLLVLLVGGCVKTEETVTYVEGRHERDADYPAAFAMQSATVGDLTLHIDQDVFDEERASAALAQIQADLKMIAETCGEVVGPAAVYVVGYPIGGSVQSGGSGVFCTYEDISSGTYRGGLLQASLGAGAHWQKIGLERYVFGEIDSRWEEEARVYYGEAAHRKTLSLLPPYFIAPYADAATVDMAEKTAALLTRYVIEEHGMEEYLAGEGAAQYRQEWLEGLGVSHPVEDFPVNVDEVRHTENRGVILLTFENFRLQCKVTDWLQTADDIYDLMDYMVSGWREITGKLESEEPDAYQMILAHGGDAPYEIKVERSGTSTTADAEFRRIRLADKETVFHELVHSLLLLPNNYRWIDEALAVKWGTLYDERPSMLRLMYELLIGAYEDATDEDREFFSYVRAYYEKEAPLPTSVEELDQAIFDRASGNTKLVHPELSTMLSFVNVPIEKGPPIEREKGVIGNDFTYAEAFVIVEYLIEQYSLEDVLTVAFAEKPFEEVFGTDLKGVYDAYMSTLLTEAAGDS